MAKNANNLTPPFARAIDAVRYHVDRENVTVKQLAMWCGKSERQVYNWLGGEGGPDSIEVQMWLQRMPEPVRLDVASAQLAGSHLAVRPVDVESDGGKSCMPDALELNELAGRFARTVHQAEADGLIDQAEAMELTNIKNAMLRLLEAIEQRKERRTRVRLAQ